MKLILSIILCCSLSTLLSQSNLTKNWYFGGNVGVRFEDTGILILNNGKINTLEGCSSISDKNGNLLLYSDGINVWNKFHKIIKNGNGLLGDISSTQSVLILNHIENDSIYYIITTPYAYNYNIGMRYNIVNIKGNNDSAEIVSKNNILHANSSEKVNAVNHSNGRDIWIVGHEYGNNNFYTYLLTKKGFVNCPNKSGVGFNLSNSEFLNQGYIKFSSDGKKLVNTFLYDNNSGYIEIFNFNNQNGLLRFSKQINNVLVYGCEFSSDFEKLYLTDQNKLIQINLNTYSQNTIYTNFNTNIINSLQMAKNKKIYLTLNDSNYLSVINFPDSGGLKCGFQLKGLNLFNKKSKFGLPNFNQSYFYTPSINYSYEMNCINNSIQFEGYDTIGAVTHYWQTKKLYSVNNYISIGNTKNTTHQFADTGTYIVRYIADNGNRKDTVEKTITLYPKIKKDFLGKDTTIAQGSLFNIQLKSPQPSHCQEWHFERLNTQINKGSTNNIVADSIGKYICKTTNQAFCEVIDTLIINECFNNLTMPSIYRNLTDTLFTYQPLADSFVWYKNNQQMAITKQPYIKVKDTGTYRVEAAKKGHCNRSSNTFYINKLGVKHYTLNDFNIKVYPNPSNGIINIESDKNYKLKVTDLIGRTILETEKQKQVELTNGVYYLRFEVDGYVVTEKVVIL